MKPVRISPTQLKLYDAESNPDTACPRKWGITYIDGIRTPPTAKMQFGTDGHKELENWLKHGVMPSDTPEGNTAKQSIRKDWLPMPDPSLLIEYKIEFDLGNGVTIIGYIDCVEPAQIPVVIDHKFTGSLRWSLSPGELWHDQQAVVYVRWAMDYFGTNEVMARWNYHSASNPKNSPRKPNGARKSEALLTEDGTQEAWDRILVVSQEMAAHRRTEDLKGTDLPTNSSACGAFGGCPFRGEQCKLSAGASLAGHIAQYDRVSKKKVLQQCGDNATNQDNNKEKPMAGLLDKLKQKKAEANKEVQTKGDETKVNPPKNKQAAKPKKAAAPATTNPPVVEDELVVFFDALFEKNRTEMNGLMYLGELLAPLALQVAEENKVAHWALVEFAKGGPMLAAKLDAWLEETKLVGVIIADGTTPECKAVKEVLREHASVVVQGVR